MDWKYRVKIKHLMSEDESYEAVQRDMNAIADVLECEPCFRAFDISQFRSISRGDKFFAPVDYGNKLLDRMYDYADANSIWIE